MNLQSIAMISTAYDFPLKEKQHSKNELKRTFHSISDIESYIEHDQISKKISKKLHVSRKILLKPVRSSYRNKLNNSNHEINEILSLFINDMILPEECPSISLDQSSFNATFLTEFLSDTKSNPLQFWENIFMLEQDI